MFPTDTELQPTAVASEAEPDTLAQIEERVLRTVELVNTLRQERDSALRQLAEARSSGEIAEASNRSLSEEILSLKAERQLVRSRLERLLGHIDQLS